MNHLMAGLVSTTGCFSIALAIASSNKIISERHTIFSWQSPLSEAVILAIFALFIVLAIMYLMRSEIGLLLRAVGENPRLLVHLGKSADRYHCAGFIMANAITAIAGSLFVQWSGFFSITGNIGVLVTGLATLMMAELVSKRLSLGIVLAAIFYQGVFLVTLEVGVDPVFNNLIKAMVMVALVIAARALARGKNHA
jgi:putative ABC transport system permease protein